MDILQSRIEKNKKDLAFEWEHRAYFKGLYLRVLVLMLLCMVAGYYLGQRQLCEASGGVLEQAGHISLRCVLPQPDQNLFISVEPEKRLTG